MKHLLLAFALAAIAIVTGCDTTKQIGPWASTQTPQAGAAISDECTTASLHMGALGEFELTATHCRMADGTTTGSVHIKGTKDTLNNFNVGLLGFLAGIFTHGVIK